MAGVDPMVLSLRTCFGACCSRRMITNQLNSVTITQYLVIQLSLDYTNLGVMIIRVLQHMLTTFSSLIQV